MVHTCLLTREHSRSFFGRGERCNHHEAIKTKWHVLGPRNDLNKERRPARGTDCTCFRVLFARSDPTPVMDTSQGKSVTSHLQRVHIYLQPVGANNYLFPARQPRHGRAPLHVEQNNYAPTVVVPRPCQRGRELNDSDSHCVCFIFDKPVSIPNALRSEGRQNKSENGNGQGAASPLSALV